MFRTYYDMGGSIAAVLRSMFNVELLHSAGGAAQLSCRPRHDTDATLLTQF